MTFGEFFAIFCASPFSGCEIYFAYPSASYLSLIGRYSSQIYSNKNKEYLKMYAFIHLYIYKFSLSYFMFLILNEITFSRVVWIITINLWTLYFNLSSLILWLHWKLCNRVNSTGRSQEYQFRRKLKWNSHDTQRDNDSLKKEKNQDKRELNQC